MNAGAVDRSQVETVTSSTGLSSRLKRKVLLAILSSVAVVFVAALGFIAGRQSVLMPFKHAIRLSERGQTLAPPLKESEQSSRSVRKPCAGLELSRKP
jgi:hypothetical protein